MNKVIYWIGIYAICAYTHDMVNAAASYLENKLRDKKYECSNKQHNSRPKKQDTSSEAKPTMNKIGF